ncbi:MAG: hypothetical protein AB7O62_13170 [Pirellulales bacterium]
MNEGHQQSDGRVNESFFTSEEKKIALEQVDRIQSAYLQMIETRPGEDWKRGWSYQVVTGDRLLAMAQVRAIRDEYLPPSGLSNEEKEQGVKTCNGALCALAADKLPLDLSIMRNTPSQRGNLLQYHLQFKLRYLPVELKRHGREANPDKVMRESLALLEETLAYANEVKKFDIPEDPCPIDLAVEIQEDVDEFLNE